MNASNVEKTLRSLDEMRNHAAHSNGTLKAVGWQQTVNNFFTNRSRLVPGTILIKKEFYDSHGEKAGERMHDACFSDPIAAFNMPSSAPIGKDDLYAIKLLQSVVYIKTSPVATVIAIKTVDDAFYTEPGVFGFRAQRGYINRLRAIDILRWGNTPGEKAQSEWFSDLILCGENVDGRDLVVSMDVFEEIIFRARDAIEDRFDVVLVRNDGKVFAASSYSILAAMAIV